jgi:outer membrane scaffolding protein for murein synthesis (MipA/OmpV family)
MPNMRRTHMRRLNATVAASLALAGAAIAAHATTTTSDSPAEASFGGFASPGYSVGYILT